MPVGPFDHRVKRSRCSRCAASHLKCSGEQPCTNCQRCGIACHYPTSTGKSGSISLDEGNHTTANDFAKKLNLTVLKLTRNQARVPRQFPGRHDITVQHLYYFDIFVKRNNFTGIESTFSDDVKSLLASKSGSCLRNAILAVGAMQASKLDITGAAARRAHSFSGLEAYSKSITELRDGINQSTSMVPRIIVLWTTFFLGLFELMHDPTGQSWIQHMVHGTAKALSAAGPSVCLRPGPGQRFFFQAARPFEVCRAIVFNESTFLSGSEWEVSLCGASKNELRPLDTLLDLIVKCSRLRVSTGNFIQSLQVPYKDEVVTQANALAKDGFRLRYALQAWDTENQQPCTTVSGTTETPMPRYSTIVKGLSSDNLVARIFFAATSIYLSGVFDYDAIHWRALGISYIPVLSEDEVQTHVRVILQETNVALGRTDLSALLFLFPLRVAGARSREKWQRECIRNLLRRIEADFVVARAFGEELEKVWQWMGEQIS
ncbi:hypothetical protein GQ53DRAFT_719080 [Thozetella sp. PMI_491]|nr:hypothetical protein GQ53DRAFT_719080 [Thozetella sp. PMI_491]